MGLGQFEVSAITSEWKETVSQVIAAALMARRWVWQLFMQVGAPPMDRSGCVAYFRDACRQNSTMQTTAIMFSFSGSKTKPLPFVTEDLATFLLIRGPYAWLGYQWIGCVSCNSTPRDPSGLCDPTGAYERPNILDTDYGEPNDVCRESKVDSGIFLRDWTKARVSFDCNLWKGSVENRES